MFKIQKWLDAKKKTHFLKTKFVNFSRVENWNFNQNVIYHNSKKFFKFIGLSVKTNFYKKNWDQPIIIQKEVGILGIIKNEDTNKYLLQAKIEPGNINKIQLAPTVQATKSNYQRVHGGKKIPFLKYFLNNKTLESLQSEQGFRYFNKYNSNKIYITNKKIKISNDFYWFSIDELKQLSKKKNLLNMDTLSVISSFIKKKRIDFPLSNEKNIKKKILSNDKKFFLKTKKIKLSNLQNWIYKKNVIKHLDDKYFSIIGLEINANKREISHWHQPIIRGKKLAFAGFIKSNIKGTNHYLCRYLLKPGLKNSVISCTTNTSDFFSINFNSNFPKFEKKIMKNFFLNKANNKKIIYDNILSDEGGRFYKCQIRNMIIEILDYREIKIPFNYFWLSHNQLVKFIKFKKVDIEARLLFALDNFDNII